MDREQLIIKYLPYVHHIAYKIAVHLPPNTVDNNVLIQAGIVGFIEAIDSFDHTKGVKLKTYAYKRVRGEMVTELRSRDWHSRLTRKKIREYEKAHSRIKQQNKGDIQDEDVAKELGIDLEKYHQIKRMSAVSPANGEEIRSNIFGYLIDDKINNAFMLIRVKEKENAVAKAVRELPKKERFVLSLYYEDGLTLEKIGQILKVTQARVSQIRKKAITSLRRNNELLRVVNA